MATPATTAQPTSRDDLEAVFARYPNAGREALIPLLQDVQQQVGYLSQEAVVEVGRRLGLAASKVYGVATFYNQFRFQPLGRCHIQVCRGTACHVKGSAAVLNSLRQELRIEPGQTTRDGQFSLEVVACIGACGMAPVISVNGEFHAGVTTKKIPAILKTYRNSAVEHEHDEVA